MPLSGKDMVKLYEKNGWVVLRQNGSHIRVKKGNVKETIPNHKELKKGTEIKLLKTLQDNQ